MKIENLVFKNTPGQRISARIYNGDPPSRKGIIFCHGLFSTKEGVKITWLAPHLVEAGFTLLTFDFSFVGESEGTISDLSIPQEVDDLKCAYRFFSERGIDEIHLIGSSMGGAVSLIFAASGEEIKTLTLIAAPVKLIDLMKDMTGIADIRALPDDGMTSIDGVPVKNKFIKEIEFIDTESAIEKLSQPALIIHGGMDEVVPVSSAGLINDNIKTEKRLIIIDDGNHSLSRDSDLEILKENITAWLKAHSRE